MARGFAAKEAGCALRVGRSTWSDKGQPGGKVVMQLSPPLSWGDYRGHRPGSRLEGCREGAAGQKGQEGWQHLRCGGSQEHTKGLRLTGIPEDAWQKMGPQKALQKGTHGVEACTSTQGLGGSNSFHSPGAGNSCGGTGQGNRAASHSFALLGSSPGFLSHTVVFAERTNESLYQSLHNRVSVGG